MKISEVISILNDKKETNGDLEVLIKGHPGEHGYEIEGEDFEVTDHEGGKVVFISC